MARILNTKKYPYDTTVSDDDYLIGTDSNSSLKTKNFKVSALKAFINSGNEGGGEINPDNPTDGIPNEDGTYTWIKYSQYEFGYDEQGVADMVDAPTEETVFIGLAYEKLAYTKSDDPSDYIWGDVEGENSYTDSNGVIQYTWIKYADTIISGMTDNPVGKQYIGLSFKNSVGTPESEDYNDYTWRKVTLNTGSDGIPVEGTNLYTWVKYADDASGNGMSDDSIGKLYLGLAYNKESYVESDNPSDYSWALIDGDHVWIDPEGNYHYTWVKYADTPTSGMSDEPDGKAYMGMSYDNPVPEESTDYEDYQWSLRFGDENGNETEFPQIPPQLYTWMKFSEFSQGTDTEGQPSMTDEPDANTLFTGIAVNRNNSQAADPDSGDPANYLWTAIGGDMEITLPDGTSYYIWDKYSEYEEGDPTMQDSPVGMSYIGLAYYRTTTEALDTESLNPENYTWNKIGASIEQSNDPNTWMKFALTGSYGQVDANSMQDDSAGMTHVGYAFNKQFPEAGDANSNDPSFYVWTVIGADINYLTPHGASVYLWDKYSVYKDGVPVMTDDPTGATFVGLAYDKNQTKLDAPTESDDPLSYQWSPINYIQRTDTLYLWIRFAKSEDGITGFTNNAFNAIYMGLAYNKPVGTESDIPSDYIWNLVSGNQKYIGADNKTYYTWVKYARTTVPSASDLYDAPENMLYMGVALHKLSSTKSTDFKDYTWKQFKNSEIASDGVEVNQNNVVRIIQIDPDDLPNAIISESSIAEYLNAIGIEVTDIENILFDFGGVQVREFLDYALQLPLTVSDITTSSAKLKWSANGDVAIVNYEVYISTITGIDIVPTYDTAIELSALDNNTPFEVFVRAYDSTENFKDSNSVQFKTLPVYDDNATPILESIITDDSVTLNWSISEAFAADEYTLYEETDEGLLPIYTGTATTYLTYDLEREYDYAFYVIAARNDGVPPTYSNQSNTLNINLPLGYIPLTTPTISEVNTTVDSISIGINVPFGDIALITGFIIEYRIFGTQAWVELSSSGTDFVQTIGDLKSSTSYQFRLRTISSETQSDLSNELTSTTATIYTTNIALALNEITPVELYNEEKNRDASDVYTQPSYSAPIATGTSIRIKVRVFRFGSSSFDYTYEEWFIASADYANMSDFFYGEVGTLGSWGDSYLDDYGFNVAENQFFVRIWRDGSRIRPVYTKVWWNLETGGVIKVAAGEPNGWARIKVELIVRQSGVKVTGSIHLAKANTTITTSKEITVDLDANGEYVDAYPFSTTYTGAEFTVTGTLVASSSGVSQAAGESADTIQYLKS